MSRVTVAKQNQFMRMVALLILYIQQRGYQVSPGELLRRDSTKYLHPKGLAIDLNIHRNGAYLTDSMDHLPFGEFWESMGGSWGGRFSDPDGNHYSLEHDGEK